MNKVLLLCFSLWMSFFQSYVLSAQIDSIDSTKAFILNKQNEAFSELTRESLAQDERDSSAVKALEATILALKSGDSALKLRLEKKADSLELALKARQNRLKTEVDSMRSKVQGVPILVFRDTIGYLYAKLGPYSAKDRAVSIKNKLELVVEQGVYDAGHLIVFDGGDSRDIMLNELVIMSITDRDALWAGKEKQQLASEMVLAIQLAIKKHEDLSSIFTIIKRVFVLLLVIIILLVLIKYSSRGFNYLNTLILNKASFLQKGLTIGTYELLSVERERQVLDWLLGVIKWIVIALVIYLLLPAIFSLFPSTEGIARTMLSYVLSPLKRAILGLLAFLPNLMTIVVIVFLATQFVRFLKFLSLEIEQEKLVIPSFYPDWASPTFNLLKIIIYAITFVAVFPYLPGSDSPIFQGLGVFFGLLISLGSSSAIGNIIAGLVITYMRAFKIGERVKIGEVTGDVIEKTLLVTRLKTIKNERITIPNATILNGNTINYTNSAKEEGLILNTTITIGYDVPWKQVHELLVEAAIDILEVEKDPKPFVLQTSLDDFYISYQINAYTKKPSMSATLYSQLHANIQDKFNEAGLEILSPHYKALRDGGVMAVPSEYLPKGYKQSEFHVKNISND